MKKVLLTILKEIGIALLILVILCAAIVLAFREQLPFDEEIREAEEYQKVNLAEYSISSSDRTSGIEAITITHEANSNQITEAESIDRIQTGKYTPFGSIDGTSDLPTEKIGSADFSGDTNNTEINNTSTSTEERPNYSGVGDPVGDIEAEQSETAEDAANRRTNN